MRIGDLAAKAGVSTQTIRFYERKGLVSPKSRSGAGYRQYASGAVERIRFIRQAQEIGFSLREIQELLSLRVAPGSTCGDVKQQAVQKLTDVQGKLVKLRQMERALETLIRRCRGEGPVSRSTGHPYIERDSVACQLEDAAPLLPRRRDNLDEADGLHESCRRGSLRGVGEVVVRSEFRMCSNATYEIVKISGGHPARCVMSEPRRYHRGASPFLERILSLGLHVAYAARTRQHPFAARFSYRCSPGDPDRAAIP